MHQFEPGDKVKWTRRGKPVTLKRFEEGRWVVEGDDLIRHHDVRPSELTPADLGPDAATLKVRELAAIEAETPYLKDKSLLGSWDRDPANVAFVKYLREHDAKPVLTVEALREALGTLGYDNTAAKLAVALHAALTEQAK